LMTFTCPSPRSACICARRVGAPVRMRSLPCSDSQNIPTYRMFPASVNAVPRSARATPAHVHEQARVSEVPELRGSAAGTWMGQEPATSEAPLGTARARTRISRRMFGATTRGIGRRMSLIATSSPEPARAPLPRVRPAQRRARLPGRGCARSHAPTPWQPARERPAAAPRRKPGWHLRQRAATPGPHTATCRQCRRGPGT